MQPTLPSIALNATSTTPIAAENGANPGGLGPAAPDEDFAALLIGTARAPAGTAPSGNAAMPGGKILPDAADDIAAVLPEQASDNARPVKNPPDLVTPIMEPPAKAQQPESLPSPTSIQPQIAAPETDVVPQPEAEITTGRAPASDLPRVAITHPAVTVQVPVALADGTPIESQIAPPKTVPLIPTSTTLRGPLTETPEPSELLIQRRALPAITSPVRSDHPAAEAPPKLIVPPIKIVDSTLTVERPIMRVLPTVKPAETGEASASQPLPNSGAALTITAPLTAPLAIQPSITATAMMAPATLPQAAEQPRDFGALIDRLVQAREAAGPTNSTSVRAVMSHTDFGAVTMRIDQSGAALNIGLSSQDPTFAPAIRAAMVADAPRTDDQQRGQQHANNGQSSTQSDSQNAGQTGPQSGSQQRNEFAQREDANTSAAKARGDETSDNDLGDGRAEQAAQAAGDTQRGLYI